MKNNKKQRMVKVTEHTLNLLKQIQDETNQTFDNIIRNALSTNGNGNKAEKILGECFTRFIAEAYIYHRSQKVSATLELLRPIIRIIIEASTSEEHEEIQDKIASLVYNLR